MKHTRSASRAGFFRSVDRSTIEFCKPLCDLLGIDTRRKRASTLVRLFIAISEDPIVSARSRMITEAIKKILAREEVIKMLTEPERRQVRERVLRAVSQRR